MFIIPLTFKKSGRLTKAAVCTAAGVPPLPNDAPADEKFGGEWATKPIDVKIIKRLNQTALQQLSDSQVQAKYALYVRISKPPVAFQGTNLPNAHSDECPDKNGNREAEFVVIRDLFQTLRI